MWEGSYLKWQFFLEGKQNEWQAKYFRHIILPCSSHGSCALYSNAQFYQKGKLIIGQNSK